MTMTADEARARERAIAENNQFQGETGAIPDHLESIGTFVRDFDDRLLYHRTSDGRLYAVNADPRSAFGQLVGNLFSGWEPSARRETIEDIITRLGLLAPVVQIEIPRRVGPSALTPLRLAGSAKRKLSRKGSKGKRR